MIVCLFVLLPQTTVSNYILVTVFQYFPCCNEFYETTHYFDIENGSFGWFQLLQEIKKDCEDFLKEEEAQRSTNIFSPEEHTK